MPLPLSKKPRSFLITLTTATSPPPQTPTPTREPLLPLPPFLRHNCRERLHLHPRPTCSARSCLLRMNFAGQARTLWMFSPHSFSNMPTCSGGQRTSHGREASATCTEEEAGTWISNGRAPGTMWRPWS